MPFDAQAGVTARHLTPAAERLTALAGGVGESFERGARLLRELAAVRLGESTVERTTEDVGGRIEALLGQGYPSARPRPGPGGVTPRAARWPTSPSTRRAPGSRGRGPRRGGPHGLRRRGLQPRPAGGAAAPGRAAPALQARYLAGLDPRAEVGPLWRRQAGQVGRDRAEVWVALADGGSGLEGFCQQNFNRPDLVPVLDFYHPASYLEKLAKALHPGAEAAAAAQARQRCRLLKAEGGAVTLAVLRTRAWPARPSAAPRAAGGDAGVLRHQRASRGVPGVPGRGLARRQRGGGECLQDGGGAASQGGRPALAEDGAHALCHVRALYRSEEGQGRLAGSAASAKPQMFSNATDAHTCVRRPPFSSIYSPTRARGCVRGFWSFS